jgi:hypothetical protein
MPDLLLTGWLPPAFGHRTQPLHVVGPAGAKTLLGGLLNAYSGDVKGREDQRVRSKVMHSRCGFS